MRKDTNLEPEHWKAWLAGRRDNWELGQKVKAAINRQVGDLETRNLVLQRENERYAKVKQILVDSGFDIEVEYASQHAVQRHVDKIRGIVSPGQIREMERALQGMGQMVKELKKMRKPHR